MFWKPKGPQLSKKGIFDDNFYVRLLDCLVGSRAVCRSINDETAQSGANAEIARNNANNSIRDPRFDGQSSLAREMQQVMMEILFAAVVALQAQAAPVVGTISGVVVNASHDLAPVGGAKIVLRVQLDGQFVVAAECTADEGGRFVFDNLPADSNYVYLPGANLDGIHYPGARVLLNSNTPHARVNLTVHDTVSEPNPLVVRRHNIKIHAETDALRVTETLLIENPSSETYIGRPKREGGRAATLYLSIPPDFRRTTFHKEFFGQQFTLIDGQLVTDIPWTPGQRELAFTYVLPSDDRTREWRRPLDLPCDQLRIELNAKTSEVYCNLPKVASNTNGSVVFESIGKAFPADHIIHVQLGNLPFTLAAWGRWLALGLLIALIVATTMFGTRHRRRQKSRLHRNPESSQAKQAA